MALNNILDVSHKGLIYVTCLVTMVGADEVEMVVVQPAATDCVMNISIDREEQEAAETGHNDNGLANGHVKMSPFPTELLLQKGTLLLMFCLRRTMALALFARTIAANDNILLAGMCNCRQSGIHQEGII